MGQPYIELRHRAENRLRLTFPPSAELQPRPIQEPALGQQMVVQQHHVASVSLSQNSESLPGAEGIEEHLEGEDSAVKDLEDVEVKDLVDLNLNLDPEDGRKTTILPHICESFIFMPVCHMIYLLLPSVTLNPNPNPIFLD